MGNMIMKEFSHYMMREIHEQSKAVQKTLTEGYREVRTIVEEIGSKNYEMIYITGSGTSYHAGLAGQYALFTLTKLVTSVIPASEFPIWIPSAAKRRSLLIAISQSGESADVLAAVRAALKKEMDILAVTNTSGSSLTKLSRYILLTRASEELAVTATKSHTSQLAILFLLSLELTSPEEFESENLTLLRKKLFETPEFISKTISINQDLMRNLSHMHKDKSFFFLLGSGSNYPTALEGALKLKESCNIFAEGFATREFLHGPIQLLNEKTPVLFMLFENEIDSFLELMKSIRRFGAPLISISEKSGKVQGVSTGLAYIPKGFPKTFSPILYVVPLQLFAYYSSIERNLNPDKPEKLKKVVK
jgi:glucosamine--fructose-6-phosphate aminotransferase (isomerizing)